MRTFSITVALLLFGIFILFIIVVVIVNRSFVV
jgi:hypothetical protein